jgi:hypothetical protein
MWAPRRQQKIAETIGADCEARHIGARIAVLDLIGLTGREPYMILARAFRRLRFALSRGPAPGTHWVLVAVCLYGAAAIVAVLLAARGNDDAIGYLASLLVFGSFLSPSMAPLRVLAILSNVAFIAYALKCWLPPVLCLHAALLPVNVFRLIQLTQARSLRFPAAFARARRSNSAGRSNTSGDL